MNVIVGIKILCIYVHYVLFAMYHLQCIICNLLFLTSQKEKYMKGVSLAYNEINLYKNIFFDLVVL